MFSGNTFSVSECTFNPLVPDAPFLYPLKTSENLSVLWCFQGVEKGCIRNKWVKIVCLCKSCSKSEIYCEKEKELAKNFPEQSTSVCYLYVILFRMHERCCAAEIIWHTELIILQMSLDRVVVQRFKQIAE